MCPLYKQKCSGRLGKHGRIYPTTLCYILHLSGKSPYFAGLWQNYLSLSMQCKKQAFWSALISAGTFQTTVLWRNGSPGLMQFLCCGCTKRWPIKRTALFYPKVISLMLEHVKYISEPAGKDWATILKYSFAGVLLPPPPYHVFLCNYIQSTWLFPLKRGWITLSDY